MSLKLVFKASVDEFGEAFKELEAPIRAAATGAVRDAANLVKTRGRAEIGSAGFSARWQNALRVDVYPERGASLSPAAWVYHKIPYAEVFEEGATIRGKPTLWIPLSNIAGERIGGDGRRRVTAQSIGQRYGQILFPINRPGAKPLLAVKVRGGYNGGPVSGSLLSTAVKRGERIGRRSGLRLQTVPLFVGVDSVTLRKRFGIRKICADVTNQLEALYLKNFKAG